ncbi:MAG TPA: hypothetical protein VE954_34715 [Oligoflexus sp.]|uniref:hypothetical protein n=1 Tax=Oligoflexus sp. TaxID=1971216 RepID=UPI002D6B2E79|nr:hypothetical protein [Oligoflexus sp.]HYX38284.1 hypothetical protein [Oligoflexus sp.]
MNGPHARNQSWVEALLGLKERLQEPILWFPFPALIAFGLVIILRGHLLTGLNPRLGARVDVIQYDAKNLPDGGIWLGVFQDGKQVLVVTSDRRRFTWPIDSQNMKDVEPLVTYLKNRVKKEAYSTAIKLESNLTRTTAVLAVDQKLKYIHLRPVIYALAEARIAKYGFETRVLKH